MNESSFSDERRLFNYLMLQYEKAVRPVRHQTDNVSVTMTMDLLSIEKLVGMWPWEQVAIDKETFF